MKQYQNNINNAEQNNGKKILSVAMCTYNGAQYLQEQLDSIADQTRLPNELVVCDDSSTDTTLQVLERFQEMAPFPVRIYRNETNLGSTKNFEKAISLCSGDIIALSDQDDVWMPYKLERLEKVLENCPHAGYVFSDALVVDEELRPLGYTMWDRVSFTTRQRRCFKQEHQLEVLLKHNVVTGATMAFRASLRDLILPIPDQWVHDAWIALLASAAGARGIFIEESLIKYRQHPSQVIGGMKISLRKKVLQALSTKGELYEYEKTKYTQFLNRLVSVGIENKIVQKLVVAKIHHLEARQFLHETSSLQKRVKLVLQELIKGRYHKFSNGWQSIIKDLLLNVKSLRR